MNQPEHTLLLGVTGGIAAYKAADLASKLRQAGVQVQVVMTSCACEFITPLTFEYITGNPVITNLFTKTGGHNPDHIALADAADAAVIAPATANIIGKIANGIADDALSTIIMAFDKPVIMAPAMNHRMYKSVAVQENLQRLKSRGIQMVGPAEGWLACGEKGIGRMSEASQILETVMQQLKQQQDR